MRLCCPRGPAPWLAKHGIDLCLVDLDDLGHVSASSTQMKGEDEARVVGES